MLVSFLDAFDGLGDDCLPQSCGDRAAGRCALVDLPLRCAQFLIFPSELVDVGVPLAAVESDGRLFSGRDAFADGEDLGRDLLRRVELSLRGADPLGAEVCGADRRICEEARGR